MEQFPEQQIGHVAQALAFVDAAIMALDERKRKEQRPPVDVRDIEKVAAAGLGIPFAA